MELGIVLWCVDMKFISLKFSVLIVGSVVRVVVCVSVLCVLISMLIGIGCVMLSLWWVFLMNVVILVVLVVFVIFGSVM